MHYSPPPRAPGAYALPPQPTGTLVSSSNAIYYPADAVEYDEQYKQWHAQHMAVDSSQVNLGDAYTGVRQDAGLDGQSGKTHAQRALQHYKRHTYKYVACKLVSAAAIIIGCVLGIVAYVHYRSLPLSAARLVAGKAGTTIATVNAVPAKARMSYSRRLQDAAVAGRLEKIPDTASVLNGLRRQLSSTLKAPTTFPATADYNVFGTTNLVVGDPSLDALDVINMIGCLTRQLRSMDVGLNATFNPYLKPYVALVDTGVCGNSQGEVQSWAVSSSGPSGLGDGNYSTTAIFNGFGGVMHVVFNNSVKNSAVASSAVVRANPGSNIYALVYMYYTYIYTINNCYTIFTR